MQQETIEQHLYVSEKSLFFKDESWEEKMKCILSIIVSLCCIVASINFTAVFAAKVEPEIQPLYVVSCAGGGNIVAVISEQVVLKILTVIWYMLHKRTVVLPYGGR